MKIIVTHAHYRNKLIKKIQKKHKNLLNKLGSIHKYPINPLNIIIKYYEIIISVKTGSIMSKCLTKYFYNIIKMKERW